MCMKENLIHSRTCVYNINYHVVWSVKYRRKILSAEIEIYLKELVQKIASDKGFTVHLFEVGEGDHIHCFVSAPPKLSVTDIVKYLKGITGRKLFEKSGNPSETLERSALESLILCRNNRFGVGRKYPTLYRASEQILLEGGKICC